MYYKITYTNPFEQQETIWIDAKSVREAFYKAEKLVDMVDVLKCEKMDANCKLKEAE